MCFSRGTAPQDQIDYIVKALPSKGMLYYENFQRKYCKENGQTRTYQKNAISLLTRVNISCGHITNSQLNKMSKAQKQLTALFMHNNSLGIFLENIEPKILKRDLGKGPVKLMQRVKIAHSFLQSVSYLLHFIILSLSL